MVSKKWENLNMKKISFILLAVMCCSCVLAASVGVKYWNAPFSDEDDYPGEWGDYDPSSYMGLTASWDISDNRYISIAYLTGEFTHQGLAGLPDYEQSVVDAEFIVGQSFDKFDFGIGIRVYEFGNNVIFDDGSSYGHERSGWGPLLYISSSHALTQDTGIYGGLSLVPYADGGEWYDDEHYNFEVGVYHMIGQYSATLGYRYIEYYASGDSYESISQSGIAGSINYHF